MSSVANFQPFSLTSQSNKKNSSPALSLTFPQSWFSSANPPNLGFSGCIAKVEGTNKPSSFAKLEAVRSLTGSIVKTEGLRFAVVVARFNEIVTKLLLEGAIGAFQRHSVKEEDIDVVWVPGCFEIGIVAEKLGKSGKYDAILCIGAVIRGDTSHYDAVANSAASGVLSAGLNSGKTRAIGNWTNLVTCIYVHHLFRSSCIFGVLTCDNMDQAIDRSGGKAGNKGAEAALTAIEMASLFEHHLKQ